MNKTVIKEAMRQYARSGILDVRKAKAALESSKPYGLYGRYEPGYKYTVYLKDRNNNEHKIVEFDTRKKFNEMLIKQKIERFNTTHRSVLSYSKLRPDAAHLNTIKNALLGI